MDHLWSPVRGFTRSAQMESLRAERSAAPRFSLCSLLLLILLLGLSAPSPAEAWDLVLLHTNDVHARVEETSVFSGKCGSNGECFAGVARRATVIQNIRNSESNVLLLDAGDQFQGTVWFNYYKGAEAAHFMNKLRYDAMVGDVCALNSKPRHARLIYSFSR